MLGFDYTYARLRELGDNDRNPFRSYQLDGTWSCRVSKSAVAFRLSTRKMWLLLRLAPLSTPGLPPLLLSLFQWMMFWELMLMLLVMMLMLLLLFLL